MLPEPDLTIAPVSERDGPQLLQFYLSLSDAVARDFLPPGAVSPDAVYEHLSLVSEGSCVSLGLFDGQGRILGHGFIQGIDTARPMVGIGLHESVIGHGYGRRIMEMLLEEADRRGVAALMLNVVKTNTRAERLYASLGFVRRGHATFRVRNDSWAMERRRPKDRPPADP